MTGFYRKNRKYGRLIVATFTIMFVAVLMNLPLRAQSNDTSGTAKVTELRDTLFVLDSTFIEIDLSMQELYQHFRSGGIDTHLCSSGNPDFPRSLATRPGIYTIKGKAREHRSSRFDVMMYFWMPFDGGIGLHSLTGSKYYPYLGYQPSSHGCVRLSNESAEEIFDATPIGTVVFVHDGNPLRIVRLASTTGDDLRVMKRVDHSLLRKRLEAVRNGKAGDRSLIERLTLPAGKKSFAKIDVGEEPQQRTSEKR